MTGLDPDPSATVPPQFACPECGTTLPAGAPACGSCGIRLRGPYAQRLWQVDQQIAGLSAESRRLRALLLQPPGAEELALTRQAVAAQPAAAAPAGQPATVPAPGPAPVPAPGPAPVPNPGGHTPRPPLAPSVPAPPVLAAPAAYATPPASRGLSGQQLLLGLAALLLLSGVSFFLVVVWSLIGIVGQALVMVVLTVAAAGGAVLMTRKRLGAAAETFAVIASGLVLLDLGAAHRLGLAGLDRWGGAEYWSVAGLVGAAVLLAFDAWVPRRDADGELRRVVVLRPFALALVTSSLWAAVVAVAPRDPDATTVSAAALLVGVVSLGLVAAGHRLDGARDWTSASTWLPWTSAVTALGVHWVAAAAAGYGDVTGVDRALATLLLLVLPGVLLVAQAGRRFEGRQGSRVVLRLVGLVGVVLALGVPVFALPRPAVALVAALVGVGLLVLALLGQDAPADRPRDAQTWGDLLTWTGRLAVGGLFFLLFLLIGGGHATGVDMSAWRSGAGPGQWWLPVAPAAALAVPSVVSAVRRGSVLVATLAHLSAMAGVLVALREAAPMTWAVVTLVGAVVSLSVAGAARWAALEGGRRGMEPVALVAAGVYAVTAVGAGVEVSPFVVTAVLVGLGALLLAYATLPGRWGLSYPAALALTVALWIQLAEGGVGAVEAYTLPVAAMLAGIGAVHWLHDRRLPTFLTMGPALLMGLFPSLVVALSGDSLARLLAVTCVAALLLVVGTAQRWQAPVVLSAVALGLVALTQGGPLVAYVPGWMLLVGAGAALLVVGIAWERSIALGRRTWVWLGAMQ